MSSYEFIKEAERILMPKNKNLPIVTRFLNSLGVSVPDFRGTKTVATSEGKSFYLYKDDYVLDRVSRALADVGFLGSDFYLEQETSPEAMTTQFFGIGERIGQFVLASPKSAADEICAVLASQSASRPYLVATKYKRNFERFVSDTNFPLFRVGSGSVEADLDLLGCDSIFDITASGITLEDNSLKIVAEGAVVELGVVFNVR